MIYVNSLVSLLLIKYPDHFLHSSNTQVHQHTMVHWQNETDLVVRHVIEHLLDLRGVFHVGGDWVGGAEGVHLHGLKTFPQEEVILGEREFVYSELHCQNNTQVLWFIVIFI